MNACKKPVKAAFEITKGTQQVMTLSEAEVERYLDLRELLDGLEDGFRRLELGEVQSPPRPMLSVAGKGLSFGDVLFSALMDPLAPKIAFSDAVCRGVASSPGSYAPSGPAKF